MKTLRPLYLATTLTLGCAAGTPTTGDQHVVGDLPQTFTLAAGETRKVGSVRIGFVRVTEDSRCPTTVTCVWAGNGRIELELSGGPGTETVLVNTTTDPKTVSYDGLVIELVGLAPAPTGPTPIPADDYRADLKVGRRSAGPAQ